MSPGAWTAPPAGGPELPEPASGSSDPERLVRQ